MFLIWKDMLKIFQKCTRLQPKKKNKKLSPKAKKFSFSLECIKHNAIFLQNTRKHWKPLSEEKQFAFILIGNNSDSFLLWLHV